MHGVFQGFPGEIEDTNILSARETTKNNLVNFMLHIIYAYNTFAFSNLSRRNSCVDSQQVNAILED